MSLTRRAAAEALGTFGLVFIGCGAVVATALPGSDAGLLEVALAHAIVLGVLATAALNISGAHFNPAVTIGFLAAGRISLTDGLGYLAAQLAAGLAGAWLVGALMPQAAVDAVMAGTPMLGNGTSLGSGIVLEAVFTFFLMSAIYGTAVDPRAPKVGGFGIGLTLLFLILVGGPLTGAAMNPARAVAPAIVSGHLVSQAVWWIGPILGALAATALWEKVLLEKPA